MGPKSTFRPCFHFGPEARNGSVPAQRDHTINLKLHNEQLSFPWCYVSFMFPKLNNNMLIYKHDQIFPHLLHALARLSTGCHVVA